MTELGLASIFFGLAVGVYTYAGYPLLLSLLAYGRNRGSSTAGSAGPRGPWPRVSIAVPVYNEERQIAVTLERLLALDYPADRRQIVVVSDASTDRTDEIVLSYADRGVQLLRMPTRGGKTAAENATAALLTGDIVINTDASIRILPDALKKLVQLFHDPEVGLASGCDVSVSDEEGGANIGEGGYVGYEMWIRDLETRTAGIVGASGCLYAIRSDLHRVPLPDSLSRDFAAALNVIERGYRAVSVSDARCGVPRARGLRSEYRRKVRTMTRGMQTLWHKRSLLNPFRFGIYSWMLLSHKISRWLVPWAGLVGLFGLVAVAVEHPWARWLSGLVVLGVGVAVGAWALSDRVHLAAPFRILAFAVMGNVAALHAFLRALRGRNDAVWEPTRRTTGAGQKAS